jgi:DNA polymerase elongation subunit (family B)
VDKSEKIAGAYVKEPKPGKYDYVVSFDLNSLYPHLIMQYAISPETLVTSADLTEEIDKLEGNVSRDQDRYENLIKAREISAKIDVDKLLNQEIDLSPFKDLDLTIAANGAMYRRVQGILPQLMSSMYDERKLYKKEMLKSKQKLVDIESEMKKRGIL